MPLVKRAAQFAPFAALSGHGEAIEETARFTDSRDELEADNKYLLDLKLAELRQLLEECDGELPVVTVTHFVADQYKSGGHYATDTVKVKEIDGQTRQLRLSDKSVIGVDDIIDISLQPRVYPHQSSIL